MWRVVVVVVPPSTCVGKGTNFRADAVALGADSRKKQETTTTLCAQNGIRGERDVAANACPFPPLRQNLAHLAHFA